MTELRPRLYLLDVEGTIAPISLVTEQLFPYARKRLGAFLASSADEPAVREDLALLVRENAAEADDAAPGISGTGDATQAAAYLEWLMDRDRKSTALKSLQGKIWKAGFESGELKGTLFEDVPSALRRWAAKGQVAIYSSGSVDAQRLLMRHSIFGDLTGLIAANFDTRTGPKMASASYAQIAASMQVAPGNAVFFSDVVKELDAARDAGLDTRLVLRAGNAPVEDTHGHILLDSFDLVD